MSFLRRKSCHFSALMLALVVMGCGSDDAGGKPANKSTVVNVPPPAQPAPQAPAAQPASPPGSSASSPSNPMAAQQAQMQQQKMPQPNNPNNPANPSMSPEMMQQMQKQKMANQSSPANMQSGSSSNEAMMNQMKQQSAMGSGPQSSMPGSSGTGGTSTDSKKKKNGAPPTTKSAQANAGNSSNSGGSGAGGNSGGGRRGGPGMGSGGQGAGSSQSQMSGNPQDPNAKQKLVPGTADEVIYHFCMALSEDDTATASDYISTKATGTAAKLRNGELADEKLEELIDVFVPLDELKKSEDQADGPNKRLIRNGRWQTITFTLKKDKEIYRISDVTFSKPKKQFGQ